MAYIWKEDGDLVEGDDVREVVERADYDALVTERDGLVEQRDTLIERVETAERGWEEARNRYADAFITSPARVKKYQDRDVREDGKPRTYSDLFKTKGDYGAY